MTESELTGLDLYFYVMDVPGRGLSLVGIESVTEAGRIAKIDAGSLKPEEAVKMLPRVQVASNQTRRRVYLVRCRFAEVMTVVLPGTGRAEPS